MNNNSIEQKFINYMIEVRKFMEDVIVLKGIRKTYFTDIFNMYNVYGSNNEFVNEFSQNICTRLTMESERYLSMFNSLQTKFDDFEEFMKMTYNQYDYVREFIELFDEIENEYGKYPFYGIYFEDDVSEKFHKDIVKAFEYFEDDDELQNYYKLFDEYFWNDGKGKDVNMKQFIMDKSSEINLSGFVMIFDRKNIGKSTVLFLNYDK